MAVIFITHALGVIAEICREVLVMYGGWVVESAPVAALFNNPMHPYTQGLLASIPRLETPRKTRLPVIEGSVPSLRDLSAGMPFQNRGPQPWRCADNRSRRSYPSGRTTRQGVFYFQPDSQTTTG